MDPPHKKIKIRGVFFVPENSKFDFKMTTFLQLQGALHPGQQPRQGAYAAPWTPGTFSLKLMIPSG